MNRTSGLQTCLTFIKNKYCNFLFLRKEVYKNTENIKKIREHGMSGHLRIYYFNLWGFSKCVGG